MFDYSNLKPYIVPRGTIVRCGESQHCFYPVTEEELSQAEALLSMRFPEELRKFYLEVGCGTLGNDDPDFRNEIMHPVEAAKLKLGLDFYANMYQEDLDYYTAPDVFPFFDLGGEADYLVIQLTGEHVGAIIYCGRPIAASFNEFVQRMHERTDYFIGQTVVL